MKQFRYNQRVTITDAAHRLHNQHGVVKRLFVSDGRAEVAMSEDVPDELRSYPVGNPRRNWVTLRPEQCEKET